MAWFVYLLFIVYLFISLLAAYYLDKILQGEGMSSGLSIAISLAVGVAVFWAINTFATPIIANMIAV